MWCITWHSWCLATSCGRPARKKMAVVLRPTKSLAYLSHMTHKQPGLCVTRLTNSLANESHGAQTAFAYKMPLLVEGWGSSILLLNSNLCLKLVSSSLKIANKCYIKFGLIFSYLHLCMCSLLNKGSWNHIEIKIMKLKCCNDLLNSELNINWIEIAFMIREK